MLAARTRGATGAPPGDGDAADLDVLAGEAGLGELHGAQALELADGLGPQGGVVLEALELVGVGQEVQDGVADEVGGGLVAGGDEAEQDADELAVGDDAGVGCLGLDQGGDEVVPGVGAAVVDDLLGEVDAAQEGGGQEVAVHGGHGIAPGAPVGAVGLVDADELADDGDGQGVAVGLDEVDGGAVLAGVGELVQEGVGDGLDAGAKLATRWEVRA